MAIDGQESVAAPPRNSRDSLRPLLAAITDKRRAHNASTLRAAVRDLLLAADLGLTSQDVEMVDLDPPFGGRYIDIEVGYTVIQVKSKIGDERVILQSEGQLARYVQNRSRNAGQRYIGILTDGAQWRAYHLCGEALSCVTTYHSAPSGTTDGMALYYWLEGVLATRQGIPASPIEVAQRLGAMSTSHVIDRAALANLYSEHRNTPTVQIKRQLWAQLLRSALGTQFVDDDELFIEHTLLMNSAGIIAHLILGIDVLDLQPTTLLSGQRFDQAGIYGVVEQDFFNWTVEVPGGATFVQAIARRLARFDWSHVEHDILKILYESFIGTSTRKRLGEYYTPDWLADRIVASAVTDPLHQRVLDPACGSGTFLFYAVRRYLAAADAAGISQRSALSVLSRQVIGVDLHPVAVALARVTYLLAIGRGRLTGVNRDAITVPVYLGDSIQWRERLDLFTEDHLKIRAGHGASLLEDVLRFPQSLLDDPARFDRLVSNLAALAAKPRDKNTVPSLTALFHRMAISDDDQPVIRETFGAMCRLHDEGRNHIWSYYLRNLARPLWLAMPENRVDVLVGNPPWLSYRHMPSDMQTIFKQLSQDRGLWHGGEVATHQDLSALFSARAIQQYLRVGGTFALVLPNAVLDRAYFKGFRTGSYKDPVEPVAVTFKTSWDLRRIRPHIFLRGSCVLFGDRVPFGEHSALMPEVEHWTGRLPARSVTWQMVRSHLNQRSRSPEPHLALEHGSPYGKRFVQGATIVPRVLFFVDAEPTGPLGMASGTRPVKSARSNYEKAPWKGLLRLDGLVETEFIRPVLLGESLLPFRILRPRHAVLPILGEEILRSGEAKLHYFPGLADWWTRAETLWDANRSSTRLSLYERLNFRRGLEGQLPASPLRLVYGKSGMHVAASIVADPYAIIDHKLYWATITSWQEGDYLSAILNSASLTNFVRPLMSYGKDERDIDKHVWKLSIPIFDLDNPVHRRLASIGQSQREKIANMDVGEGNFITIRRRLRDSLSQHSASAEAADIISRIVRD